MALTCLGSTQALHCQAFFICVYVVSLGSGDGSDLGKPGCVSVERAMEGVMAESESTVLKQADICALQTQVGLPAGGGI